MAVQAALTGHLVFSTLHTNDAPSAISRLLELGVPPYLINATVLGVLAQRLVRTLCPHCKTDDDRVNAQDVAALAKPWTLNGGISPKRGMGCIECRMTGFKGRTGLYELLSMSEDMKALIHASPDITALRRQAVKEGMHPLRVVGVSKVASGQTSIAEVLQTTPVMEFGT
jgi:general secretion pathway protein E